MRFIKKIMAVSAAVIAAVACSIVSEDTFSKSPVAPVLDAHSDILITDGTKAETVTFTWTAARFIEAEEYLYNLYVRSGEKDALLAEGIGATWWSVSKEELRAFLKDGFELEKNTTHALSFYLTIADSDGNVYTSEPLAVKVYFYDDAVPSVAKAATEDVVLDKENPGGELALLSWTAARLVYGEKVTYKVTVAYGDKAETVLAEGIDGTSYTTTVDAFNEAVIAAGAPEGVESELKMKVYACCESIPDGVASNELKINVTTYIATFPEKMWVPGSHQGWDPATAPTLSVSKNVKGLYQGFVDLTTADAADVSFKFSPAPKWEGDFYFEDVLVKTVGETLTFAYAESSKIAAGQDNITVPSGLYYIKLDKKFGTLNMVQVKNLELIGDFAASGWNTGIKMTRDGANWVAPQELELKNGEELKIRFNSDWTYSFGGKLGNVAFRGDNIVFDKPDGTYRLTFNASTSDFTIDVMDVNMPDYLVIAGDYSGHDWKPAEDMRIWLKDSSTGLYKGYATMYGATYGFKFVKTDVWYGHTAVDGGIYSLIEGDDGKNLTIEDGSYYWEVSLSEMTAKSVKIETAGIIGSFEASKWGADIPMAFDETTLTWSAEVGLKTGDEFKFRFNGNWDYNLGLTDGNLVHDGGNISVGADGTYKITLDMAHGDNPSYTIVAQ